MNDLLFDGPERQRFERRLAVYLAGRPEAEHVTFLNSHGVPADETWLRHRLRREISQVLRWQDDPATEALAQQMLVGGGVQR